MAGRQIDSEADLSTLKAVHPMENTGMQTCASLGS